MVTCPIHNTERMPDNRKSIVFNKHNSQYTIPYILAQDCMQCNGSPSIRASVFLVNSSLDALEHISLFYVSNIFAGPICFIPDSTYVIRIHSKSSIKVFYSFSLTLYFICSAVCVKAISPIIAWKRNCYKCLPWMNYHTSFHGDLPYASRQSLPNWFIAEHGLPVVCNKIG